MTNQKQPKLTILLPFLLASVLGMGILIGTQVNTMTPGLVVSDYHSTNGGGALHGKVEELLRYIEAKYVDDVDRDKLVGAAINQILNQLDPHSSYISAADLVEVNEQLEGNFDGIGVEFLVLDDTVVVVAPLAGGPSEAVGIMAGDKIVTISDSLVAGNGTNVRDVVKLLRGEKGTIVSVGIWREGDKELRNFRITRDEIPVHSVDVAYMLDERTGYIKVNRFSANTHEEFMKGLEVLVDKKGMKNLVIDLRHNPGGYLQQATNMLSQLFKEKGKLLVYTEGRTANRAEYKSTGRAFFDVKDIVVLIDEGSASASEIMAGAIQDHDRGVVIGRRSFGKGLVQEQYQLSDGAALRLTVARYYTPSNRSIQRPYDNGTESYEYDIETRLASGELSQGNVPAQDTTTRYYTDGGHVVYGGGGILPDVFVPIDSTLFDEQYTALRQYVPSFVLRHLSQKETALKRYDADSFAKEYTVSDPTFKAFMTYVSTRGIKTAPDKISAPARREIKRFIKARMAKQLFGDDAYYRVWNMDDSMVRKALDILSKPNPLLAARGN